MLSLAVDRLVHAAPDAATVLIEAVEGGDLRASQILLQGLGVLSGTPPKWMAKKEED